MCIIEEENLSEAWAKTFIMSCNIKGKCLSPLIVCVNKFDEDNNPYENSDIVELLGEFHEREKKTANKNYIHTVANTIFPYNFWLRSETREEFYSKYLKILDKLRSIRLNNYGLYFERMISYHSGNNEINQIEKLIDCWCKVYKSSKYHRRPYRRFMQISIVDPNIDLGINSRSRNFPCLHQIALDYDINDKFGINIIAYYPTQYLFQRAYGNYLGLARLGRFFAYELGNECIGQSYRLNKLTCIIGRALVESGTPRELSGSLQNILNKGE